MADRLLRGVVRRLRRLTAVDGARESSDRELLRRFLAGRDEAAFAALVRRHGATVLGVCRRVLGNAHDAEDAFQATFLVLSRRARSVRKRDSLASWLHGVAYRVAAAMRRHSARRRAREGAGPERRAADPAEEVSWRDVRSALDDELARLPERFRAPLVLCYLEGKTRDEAARQLGWSPGALRGRLERGRDLLRARLVRRGLALPAALAAVALAPDPVVAVSAALLAAAVRVGTAMPGMIAAPVLSVAEEVSKTMFLKSVRVVAGLVIAIGLLGTGAGALSYGLLARAGAAAPPADVPEAQAPPGGRAADEKLRQELERLRDENERLRRDLLKVQDRVKALEAEKKAPAAEGRDVRYKGEPVSHWLAMLQDRDAGFRRTALQALGHIGEVDPKVIPVIAERLKDRDAGVGATAVEALAQVGAGDPQVFLILVGALKEERFPVQDAAIRALARLGDPKAVPALAGAMQAKEAGARQAAAVALAQFGPRARPAAPALAAALRDPHQEVRDEAALALIRIGPAAVRAVADVLKDPSAEARLAAVVALAGGGHEAVPLLAATLKDQDKDIRRQAAENLGFIGARDKGTKPTVKLGRLGPVEAPGNVGADAGAALPALGAALKDSDREVRLAAVMALAKMGPEAKPDFAALLSVYRNVQKDEPIRVTAARALWGADPVTAARERVLVSGDEAKRALPALIRALEDKDPAVRSGVAAALGDMGPDAASALPALKQALTDKDSRVREAAAKALGKINDP